MNRDGKPSQIVGKGLMVVGGWLRDLRRDKIGEAMICLPRRLWHLLPQEVEGREFFRALLIAIKVNVIADRIGRPKSVNASCRERVFGDDLIEQLLGIIEKFLRLFSNRGIVKDCWIPTAQFPCVKEW